MWLTVSRLHLARIYIEPVLWFLNAFYNKFPFLTLLTSSCHVSTVARVERREWLDMLFFCFWQRRPLCCCQWVTCCNVSCCVCWLRNPQSPLPNNFWDERQENWRAEKDRRKSPVVNDKYFDNNFAGFSFSKGTICCFVLSHSIENGISLGFWILFRCLDVGTLAAHVSINQCHV